MLRVLLVYEDFQDLGITETYLKKVGFDVLSLMNEMAIQENILSFNPEVIIANGKSAKVSTLSVGRKLKDTLRYDGKVILIIPKTVRPQPGELMRVKMDAVMEAPVNAEKMLQTLAKFAGISSEALLEKLRKARLSDPELNKNLMVVSSNPKPSPGPNRPAGEFADPVRAKKYAQIISETPVDPQATSFDRNELKIRQAELKKTWDYDNLEEIDKLKRQFASALFKKK